MNNHILYETVEFLDNQNHQLNQVEYLIVPKLHDEHAFQEVEEFLPQELGILPKKFSNFNSQKNVKLTSSSSLSASRIALTSESDASNSFVHFSFSTT